MFLEKSEIRLGKPFTPDRMASALALVQFIATSLGAFPLFGRPIGVYLF